MNNETKLRQDISDLHELTRILFQQRIEADTALESKCSELIAITCKHVIGQHVKTRRGEFVISNIIPNRYFDIRYPDSYKIMARKILKSGELHKLETDIYLGDLK